MKGSCWSLINAAQIKGIAFFIYCLYRMTSYPRKKRNAKAERKALLFLGHWILFAILLSPIVILCMLLHVEWDSKTYMCASWVFWQIFFELGILIFLYCGQKRTFKKCILISLNTSFVIKELETCVCSLTPCHIILDGTMAYSMLHSLCNNLTW